MQLCPSGSWTHDVLIISPMCYRYATAPSAVKMPFHNFRRFFGQKWTSNWLCMHLVTSWTLPVTPWTLIHSIPITVMLFKCVISFLQSRQGWHTEEAVRNDDVFMQHKHQTNTNTFSFIHSFLHSFIPSFIHSFVHSLVHSFIHSFLRSFIHSFIVWIRSHTNR